jgi:type II secretory ATPase GspE/PulE/Tfp pilus assembly ATPase PilB-like protein
MLGEINNPETAQLATQFSISGHILLSTIHVPSACRVPKRLKELQADPNTTATTLKCSIAQRLVALSCPNCQRPLAQDEKNICLAHGCPKCDLDKLLNNDGCQACDGEGVNGRTAIQEFAFFDTEAERKLILATDPAPIQQHMNAKGLPSLSQKAWILAAKQIIPASQALNVANCNEYPRPE